MQIRRLEGQRFGRLTVLELAPSDKFGKARWKCRCDCGTECIKPARPLIAGESKSCGCLHQESVRRPRSHGYARTPVYRVWSAMKGRCENPSDTGYKNYGGRGIKVCTRWQSFENFLADMGEPPPGYTIDRRDNNGDYAPGNCRWATQKQQMRNTRRNILITYNGETRTLAEWAERMHMDISALHWRLREARWTIARALTTPSTPPAGEAHPGCKLTAAAVDAIRTTYAAGGISQAALAKQYGVSQSHIARILARRQRNQG